MKKLIPILLGAAVFAPASASFASEPSILELRHYVGHDSHGYPCSTELVFKRGMSGELYESEAFVASLDANKQGFLDAPVRQADASALEYPFLFEFKESKTKAGLRKFEADDTGRKSSGYQPKYQNNWVKIIGPKLTEPQAIRLTSAEGKAYQAGDYEEKICSGLTLKEKRPADREFFFSSDDILRKDLRGQALLRAEARMRHKDEEAAKNGHPRAPRACDAKAERIGKLAEEIFCRSESSHCASSEGEIAGADALERATARAYEKCVQNDGHIRMNPDSDYEKHRAARCEEKAIPVARRAMEEFCRRENTHCMSSEGELDGIDAFERAEGHAIEQCFYGDHGSAADAGEGESAHGAGAQ